jgi:phage terminase small subunit
MVPELDRGDAMAVKGDKKPAKEKQGDRRKVESPSVVKGSEPLENERHEIFCQEILLMKPQLRCYSKAYPECSYASAAAASTRLLNDVKVIDRIQFLRDEQRSRYKMTADDIHARLVMAAFVDPADLFNADGSSIAVHLLPPEIRLCIESLEIDDIVIGEGPEKKIIGTTKKIKVISKTKALELLGRHQGMFKDNINHTGGLTLEQIVAGDHE